MITFDARDFKDIKVTYKIINEKCDFYYYVENLDALYDQLVTTNHEIEIKNYRMIYENLGDYGSILIRVFLDAVKDYDKKVSLIY